MIPNILKKMYEFIIQSFEIPYDINQYHKELYYPELPPEHTSQLYNTAFPKQSPLQS